LKKDVTFTQSFHAVRKTGR